MTIRSTSCARKADGEPDEQPRHSWLWGFAPPPAPLIVPKPWKVHHLIGNGYENDLRRHVWGYQMLAAFFFVPMLAGAGAGAVDVLFPRWSQFSELGSLLFVALGVLMAVVGHALHSIDTEPPERVSLRIPLDSNMP